MGEVKSAKSTRAKNAALQASIYAASSAVIFARGIFEVPFKIPILKSGSVSIKVYPVVKNNGISATKKIYPFLTPQFKYK